jgi:hypothetical protein
MLNRKEKSVSEITRGCINILEGKRTECEIEKLSRTEGMKPN